MGATLRFLLINPTAPQWRVSNGKAPTRKTKAFRFSMLPSLYVAAAMPPGVETRIVDEDVEPIDFDAEADLVGVSFMTYNAPRAYQIADRFRQQKGKPVIFGGCHPTFMPQEAKEHCDAVCIGEAEANVPAMIADFAAGRLQPFYDRGLADLRGLPVPDRRLIRGSAYVTPNAVQATRGCPYRCRFCTVAAFGRYEHRKRPVDEVVEELRTLGRRIVFVDDNIVADRDYAKELFARMTPLRKRWGSQASIDMVRDAELLRLAHASGCRGVFVGLESLSEENLRRVHKSCNRAKDYVGAIAKLHAAGMVVFAGMVFGMDGDTPRVFADALDFVGRAKIDALQATILTPFPGTPLYEELERDGRIVDRDWGKYDFSHVVFEPRNMSRRTLQEGHDWVCGRFYSQGPVWRRIGRACRHVGPSLAMLAVAPLNFAYRSRFRALGLLEARRRAVM